ncbi:MAG TPA: hypothetical protein VK615_17410 [Candidatus Binatia bacterium]|nr:hypothetical protein [Candidatus Binatia bacterium]
MRKLSFVLILATTIVGNAAERFRTDINPALLYHQGLLMVPQLSDADRKFLFETEWRNVPPDNRYDSLVSTYRNVFKMLRRAAVSEVPCDWGIDMSDGPETLLPALARFKSVAQVACLRARKHLIAGKQAETRDELLATFVMGRNVSRDGTVISVLVQVAIENIVMSFIAENFYQFAPETLEQLAAGFNSAPARRQIHECMAVERYAFCDWLVAKINDFDAESGGNQQQLHTKLRELLGKVLGAPETEAEKNRMTKVPDEFIGATDGSAAGLIGYVKQLEPLYDEATHVLTLSWPEYQVPTAEFEKKLATHPNVLAREFLPALGKARAREFPLVSKYAMLQAAMAYKVGGEGAFKAVSDPFGDGPFTFRRFVLEGVDRGFQLQSKLNCRGFDETLILIETPGPAVRVDFKNAGEKIP